MPSLVEVAFKGNRKEFFFWNGDEPLPTKAAVIVEADRGEDLGHVYATGELVEKRIAGVAHKPTEEEPVSRECAPGDPDEVKKVAELRDQDEIARRKAMERVKANNLVMKLTDAEWRWDRRKLTIYFTADKRVDFRISCASWRRCSARASSSSRSACATKRSAWAGSGAADVSTARRRGSPSCAR
jgi:cell fate regulator YaaT (PSP1 superfamily)